MTKSTRQFEITEAVRGSFIGALGRVRYDVEPGKVSEKDVDPEVLVVLVASGKASVVKAAKPAESEESA